MNPPPRRHPIPAWAARGALRWAWLGGRGLAYYKRGGALVETYTWVEDWYQHSLSPATLRHLADTGFNLVTLPYYAGFGLLTEAAGLAAAEAAMARCQDEGMRVLAAIDVGGCCLETLPSEAADFADWLLQDADGRLVTSSPREYWRGRPDLTCAGYLAHLAEVIQRALAAGADGVWLHDVEPRCGYQPTAVAQWHRFIADHTDFYQRKCGYRSTALLSPPRLAVPGDPLCLDWEDFWAERFQQALATINDTVKSSGAERLTVVSGPFQEHHPWERYRVHVDGIHVANPWQAGVEHGEVVSQAALFLIGDAAELLAFGDGLRCQVGAFPDLPVGAQIELSLAEGLFFGGQPVSAAWAGLPEGNHAASPLADAVGRSEPWWCAFERHDRQAVVRQLLAFARRHESLLSASESAATIAILHSRDSLRFEREATVLNLRAAQLACLRRHLPADVLVSDDLAHLDRYDVLIVPEQPCLSQAALRRLSEWVRAGGGLILVGSAASRARRGRLRPPDWLVEVLGVSGSRWSLPNAEVVQAGRGRVLALPALGVEPFAYPADAPDPSAGWEWLPDAVRDVSAWPLPVRLDGPDTLFCRAYWSSGGHLVVHLLNYEVYRPAAGAVLHLNLDWPDALPEVVVHSPADDHGGMPVLPRREDAAVYVPLPPVAVYAVAEVRPQPDGGRFAEELEEAVPGFEPAVPELEFD